MPVDDRIQVVTVVKRIIDGQAERLELNKSALIDAVEYRLERWKQNTVAGPIDVDLGQISNLKFIHVRGEYQDADTGNNIEKFDPVTVWVQLNDPTAPWIPTLGLTLEGDVTSLSIQIPPSVSQEVRITLILGGAG